jgi:hypothetical protein
MTRLVPASNNNHLHPSPQSVLMRVTIPFNHDLQVISNSPGVALYAVCFYSNYSTAHDPLRQTSYSGKIEEANIDIFTKVWQKYLCKHIASGIVPDSAAQFRYVLSALDAASVIGLPRVGCFVSSCVNSYLSSRWRTMVLAAKPWRCHELY